MRAQHVEIILHLAVIQRVQAAQILQVVHRDARLVGAGRAQGAQNHLGVGVASLGAGITSLEQWQIRGRIHIALPGFACQVFFIPQLVQLDLASVSTSHRLHQPLVRGWVRRHESAGRTAIELRCVLHADDDVEARANVGVDDRVKLGPVVLRRRLFDRRPFNLVLDPAETSLFDCADGEALGLSVDVPHVRLEAVGKIGRGRGRWSNALVRSLAGSSFGRARLPGLPGAYCL